MNAPRLVLTDIEGTTTAIAFVHSTLFPFATAALPEFLALHAYVPEVAAVLRDVPPPVEATLLGWMADDVKATPLKALQGIIWRQGYADGRLRGHVWPDVAPALRRWHSAGHALAVYSSGSEEAQRLLFGFFDTRMGGKREAASYQRIAAALDVAPGDILFLSDVAEELDAARDAGLGVCQLVRAGDGTQPSGRHPMAGDFDEVARLHGLPSPA